MRSRARSTHGTYAMSASPYVDAAEPRTLLERGVEPVELLREERIGAVGTAPQRVVRLS